MPFPTVGQDCSLPFAYTVEQRSAANTKCSDVAIDASCKEPCSVLRPMHRHEPLFCTNGTMNNTQAFCFLPYSVMECCPLALQHLLRGARWFRHMPTSGTLKFQCFARRCASLSLLGCLPWASYLGRYTRYSLSLSPGVLSITWRTRGNPAGYIQRLPWQVAWGHPLWFPELTSPSHCCR